MADFTSYSDLLAKLKNDLNNQQWSTDSYGIDGIDHKFRSLDEFMRFFRQVEQRAAAETATRPMGRLHARSGGRG